MTLPKGASSGVVEAGVAFVRKFGADALVKVSKAHFKTTQNVLEKANA